MHFKLFAFLFFTILTGTFAQSNNTNGIIPFLRQNNYNSLASLLVRYPALISTLQSGGSKTLLAPSDTAFGNLGIDDNINATNSELQQRFAYHILNGTIRLADFPPSGFPHLIVPTFANSSLSSNNNRKQVVVLSQEQDSARRKEVTEVQYSSYFPSNDDGSPAKDGPIFNNTILIQQIDAVLHVPTNLSDTIPQLGIAAFAEHLDPVGLFNLTQQLNAITLFAPSDQAFLDIDDAFSKTSAQQQRTIMANHLINGTILYSSQLPSSTNHTAINATSASGQNLTFTNRDGIIFVSSGNITARIIRSDALLENGVVHLIDTVLFNTKLNQTAANDASASATNSTGSGSGNSKNDVARSRIVTASALLVIALASGLILFN